MNKTIEQTPLRGSEFAVPPGPMIDMVHEGWHWKDSHGAFRASKGPPGRVAAPSSESVTDDGAQSLDRPFDWGREIPSEAMKALGSWPQLDRSIEPVGAAEDGDLIAVCLYFSVVVCGACLLLAVSRM